MSNEIAERTLKAYQYCGKLRVWTNGKEMRVVAVALKDTESPLSILEGVEVDVFSTDPDVDQYLKEYWAEMPMPKRPWK